MVGLPIAPVVDIDTEPGITRYEVMCPFCNRVHHHQWHGQDTAFAVIAPCDGTRRYRVTLPGRDDNAMHEPVANWTE